MTPHVITMPKTVKLCDTRFYSHDNVSLIWKLWLQFSFGYDFILYQRELLMNVLSFQRILRILQRASSPESTFQQIVCACVYYDTVYPKKYAHGFCFAVLCCGYTLTDFPISIRLTSLALWQSNDCPSASKATLMNMDKYFRWIHYERLHNHNKAKHNKTVCTFLGIYCICDAVITRAVATQIRTKQTS